MGNKVCCYVVMKIGKPKSVPTGGFALAGAVEYATDSIVSKIILDKQAGTLTLFAFDTGQKLSEHAAPFDAVIEVIEGHGKVTLGGKPYDLQAGDCIIMPANVPHALDAPERFKMLLTMIRSA
jgi:quercetin dioxygenase-like cupin family protein